MDESALVALLYVLIFYCMWCYNCCCGKKPPVAGQPGSEYVCKKALPMIGRLHESSSDSEAGNHRKKQAKKRGGSPSPIANGHQRADDERWVNTDNQSDTTLDRSHVCPDTFIPFIDEDTDDLTSKDKFKGPGRLKKRIDGVDGQVPKQTKKVTLYLKNEEKNSKEIKNEFTTTQTQETRQFIQTEFGQKIYQRSSMYENTETSGGGDGDLSPGQKSSKSDTSETRSEDFVPVMATTHKNQIEAEKLQRSFVQETSNSYREG